MKNEIHILFQGDSITDGNRNKDRALDWDGNHRIGHSYAFSLCGKIALKYPDIRFSFTNRGISGDNISCICSRAEHDIIDLYPDIMTLLCGINDGPVWNPTFTKPDDFCRTYASLLTLCKTAIPDTRLVLLAPFYLPVKPHDQYAEIWAKILPVYSEIIRCLANDFGADFILLQPRFNEAARHHEPSYWLWDGIHPSEQGHGIIAEELFGVLCKNIADIRKK